MMSSRTRIPERPTAQRGRIAPLLLLLASVAAVFAAAPVSVAAPAQPTGRVVGDVVALSTGRPIAGATVRLPEFGVAATSRADGSFAFPQVFPTASPYRAVTAVVTAPGWGRWVIRGAPLYPNDTLELHAEMRTTPWEQDVVTPQERQRQRERSAPDAGTRGTGSGTCTGWDFQQVPPPTIKVWITKDGVAREYDFLFYVQHVLPSEWIPSWDADSLGAGALAVKTYAWWRAMSGHAYSSGSGCADIQDSTADQVFNPSYSTANTDKAAAATFGSILNRDGLIFMAQYFAGSASDKCEAVTGTYAGRMSQWGTQSCALDGKLWDQIAKIYYASSDVDYDGNMALNGGAEEDVSYPVLHGTATSVERTNGGASAGSWYWTISKTNWKQASLYEQRPFPGTATTAYTFRAVIKCGTGHSANCNVTQQVTVITDDGKRHTAQRTVSVPHDGVWRTYTYKPNASGFVHPLVEVKILADKAIGIDGFRVDTAFGGP